MPTLADSNCLLFWPSLASLPFAGAFLSDLPVGIEFFSIGSPGPAIAQATAGNFQALSPTGKQTFSAQYVLYSPWGTGLSPVLSTGADPDNLYEYGWWF
jgi:hypothetical protein